MILKDDLILSVINRLIAIKNSFSFKRTNLLNKSKRSITKPNSDEVYIILNGPSLKNQDISNLKGKDVIFVNRGFKHGLYEYLQPKYHVFIDPKMLTGEWPLNWLDEIVKMVPNIIFIMPVEWAILDILNPYINKGYNFYWIDDSKKGEILGVAGAAIKFAIEVGFTNIYFTGFDANGLPNEMIKR